MKIKRVYEAPAPEDGTRVLVDRLFPRGLKRGEARIDEWLRDIAPSEGLRKWFGHQPERWPEFRRRYRQELAEKGELMEKLRRLARSGSLTLLYAARDPEHNNAVVLKEVIEEN